MGISIEDRYIHTILFADDQIILARDEQDMTNMINKMAKEYRKWGLEFNIDRS